MFFSASFSLSYKVCQMRETSFHFFFAGLGKTKVCMQGIKVAKETAAKPPPRQMQINTQKPRAYFACLDNDEV